MQRHVLITGGCGFIGSHMAEALLSRRDHVTLIDDLSTGSIKNIDHFRDNKDLEVRLGDIQTSESDSMLRMEIDRADLVYHFAAAVGVFNIVNDPTGTLEKNIGITSKVLKYTSLKKKPVLLTSTSEVYGKRVDGLFKETDDLILGPTYNFRWSYAASKIVDEFLALAYWKEHKLPVVIVRLFNTIGPRQTGQYGMVVPRMIEQALTNEPITVFGTGQQTRCFTDIADVVRAFIILPDKEEAWGKIVNIGGNHSISILDLAKKIKEMTESTSEISIIPYSQAYEPGFEDMLHRAPDISLANQLMNWHPEISLDQTLQRMIRYTRERSQYRSTQPVTP